MDNLVLVSILGMGGLGFFFAAVLAAANEKLKVEGDPKIIKVEQTLPGINCGSCGLLSCHDYAVKVANNECSIDMCKPGGEATQKALAEVLGIETKAVVKQKAVIHCAADSSVRKKKAKYSGVKTCAGADVIKGGEELCEYGCLGFGDCKHACPFNAIKIVSGLPQINLDKCVACGKCVEACPRKIISLEALDTNSQLIYIACSSMDKGPQTRKTCSVGCIACGICARLSDGAFVIQNNLSIPDYKKLKNIENIDTIMLKCPTKVIKKQSFQQGG